MQDPTTTELERDDAQGLHSRRLLDNIVDHAFFMVSPGGLVESWNVGAERLQGYSANEVLGRHVSLFCPPEDVTAGKCERELALAESRGSFEDEGWRQRKDGTKFWANVIITAVRDGDGQLRGFTEVIRDLSARQAVDEHLRQSEERFRLLIDGVRDYAIFMLDASGRIFTWNAGAEHIKGYRAEEIIGKHFSRFYLDEDVRSGKCDLGLQLAARNGRFEDEGWRLRKDGTRFWASVVITALHNASGTLVGFGKVTHDLTERRKLEDERVRLAHAHEAIRLRDEFLTIASHELKTPLTTLQLQLQSLRLSTGMQEEKTAGKIDRAIRSGHRLSELIETLLDGSGISSGRLELHRHEVDLAEVVMEVVDRFRESANKAACELIFASDSGIVGSWDRVRIEQVLTNLLANALKYGAGAPVEVSLVRQDTDAIIEVKDRGAGIPEADLPRIFGRFERASSMRHYAGLGLGLYVSRQIVEAHGGAVSASNDADGGARLRVRLPIAHVLRSPLPLVTEAH